MTNEPAHGTADFFLSTLFVDIQQNCLKLPTLPEIAMRVRRATSDENVTARRLAGLIKLDTALSARLLRVANSAIYHGVRPVERLQDAITRLGNTAMLNLVSSLAILQLFRTRSSILHARMQRL